MLRKLINSVQKLDAELSDKVSLIGRNKIDKGIHGAESWCSKQTSGQINTLTEKNALQAYRYYLRLVSALTIKNSTHKELEKIKKEARMNLSASISDSIEKLVNKDEEVIKLIETKKRVDELKLR